MSDSDDSDDWFNKDLDDIKPPNVTKKVPPDNGANTASSSAEKGESPKHVFMPVNQDDYGGSYGVKVDPKKKKKQSSGGKTDQGMGFVQKMSSKELKRINQMNPLEAFLEIMDNLERFKETALDDGKSQEIVILLIIILGKVFTVPLECFLDDLTKTLFSNEEKILENDILSYLEYAIDLEEKGKPNVLPLAGEVWSNLEAFFRYGLTKPRGQNVYSFLVQQLCSFLEGKTNKNLSEKFSIFSKLNQDMEDNFFFPHSIFPSVSDFKQKPEPYLPTSLQNGRFSNDQDYLLFQFNCIKYFMMLHNYVGLKRLKKSPNGGKLAEEVVVKMGTCIVFPRVRLHKSYRQFMNFRDKYFLLNLAPHKRVNHILPPDVKKIIKNPNLRISGGGNMFYLSSSPAFDDLIVAFQIYVSNELLNEGFIVVDILHLENVKESILNRDLFLLTPNINLEQSYHTLNRMRKVSTLTLPMKEYFVDFETAAIVPDYENLKEYSFSLEEINIRAGEYKEAELAPLGMNSSQFEAFQLALTRRLSLIQGPPGTGKSSVAFKIIQRLLTNTSFRIIVVSYRNFVLDRLLLQCSKFTEKIVRLGQFCALPEVEKYRLTSERPASQAFKKLFHTSFNEYSRAMTTFVDKMNSFEDSEKVQDSFHELRHSIFKHNQLKYLKMYYECREARIIGMTTTVAAKYHDLLRLLRAPIVVMEEAAEVPEPHIINCLSDHIQQLIMIGDHKQLTHVFEVNLPGNVPKSSIFERLIENGVNNVCLNVQYRMHPDIADLVRGTIYEDLSDGENVKNYPQIRGIGRNLYFVNHENLETVAKDRYESLRKECPDYDMTSTSKENFYEMLFTVGLANYLRQQGYQSSEIIILSAYSSQAEGICEILTKFPTVKDIEVHTVDSYQGQESKIVILSLVRNNIESSIGFLISTQRLCVLLTRAQQGLFILGNMNIMAASSKEWTEIKEKLEDKDAIGPGLPIQCEKHNCDMVMTGMQDFLKFSRDGCPIGEAQAKGQGHPCLQETL